MRKYILPVYNKILHYSNKKSAPYILALCAFCEGIFFVIPPDFFLAPIALAKPKRAFFYALVCTFASLLGGMVGYLIGYILYKYVGVWLISYFHYQEKFDYFSNIYKQYDNWAIFIGGFSPIPYKFIAMFSGFVNVSFSAFVFMSLLSRALRFLLVATLIYLFADKAKYIIENHIGKITLIITIFLILIVYFIFR
ncbi:YqaA family protein [Rickettsiales bacterium LUAb2]